MPLLPSWFVLVVATQAPAPPETPAPPPVSASEATEFRALRVEVVGFDEAAVLAALRLRLPRMTVERHGGPPPEATPHAYLQVAREVGDAGRLRVITSDGRAYERGFVIEVGQEVRVAASTATNLLFSIEQGAVAPDREDVEIPATEPAPEQPAPEQPLEPAPVVPAPTMAPTRAPAPTPPVQGWEIATSLQGTSLLALGPVAHGGAYAGAGGGLGLEGRGPRGLALALDVRGLARGATAYTVGRVRIGVAVGFAWRRGRFELPALIGLAVEPWWASQSGQVADIYSGAATVRRPPLLGGSLRVTPALRLAVARGPLAAVRLGPRLELGGSFAVGEQGAQEVGLADPTGGSKVRLGGLELALGLEVALQWSLTRKTLRQAPVRGRAAVEK